MNKKKLVIRLLKRNRDGLTVVEIARTLSISRNTVAVVLAGLIGAEMVRVRPVGVAKLHYWRRGTS
ncbi:MAG: MarR family transcriptional regulator [Nanoarchaeota archaeon]